MEHKCTHFVHAVSWSSSIIPFDSRYLPIKTDQLCWWTNWAGDNVTSIDAKICENIRNILQRVVSKATSMVCMFTYIEVVDLGSVGWHIHQSDGLSGYPNFFHNSNGWLKEQFLS